MKKASSNQIVEKKISELLTEKLKNKGYKYFKGRKAFIKSSDGITYEISRHHDINKIYIKKYIVGKYDLFITFDLYFKKTNSDFEKWYKEHFSKTDLSVINLYYKNVEFCIPLIEKIDYDIYKDFSYQQQTYVGDKQYLKGKTTDAVWELQDHNKTLYIQDFESNIDSIVSITERMEETKTNFTELYNLKDNAKYLKTNALLIYNNQLELPSNFVKSRCEFLITEIRQMSDKTKLLEYLKSLEKYISIGKEFLNLNIENPFSE